MRCKKIKLSYSIAYETQNVSLRRLEYFPRVKLALIGNFYRKSLGKCI